jgi:UDP-N-acetyl-D-mannosaminuronate dehydrogenase
MEIATLIADWHGGETLVVEPNVHQLPKKLAGKATLATLEDALAQADVLVMLVDHKQFKAISGDSISQAFVVDTKGVWR